MSTPSPAVAHYVEQYHARASRLPGAGLDWLARVRTDAVEGFNRRGFPAPREEHWKYTRFTALEKRRFALADGSGSVDAAAVGGWSIPDLDCDRLVFVNGRHHPGLSNRAEHEGVTLLSFADAMATRPELIEPHLGRHTDVEHHPFNALNTAFAADGAVLHVPAGRTLERPVHLVFLADPGAGEVVSHPRILMILDDGASASVIESYGSLDGDASGRHFTNALTEATLGSDARLAHYKVQREGAADTHVASLQVEQGPDSRFESYSFSLGALLARNDINVRLAAPGASCSLDGLFVGNGRQHTDYLTRVDHLSPDCTSHETYKGVLDGRSRGVFNGRVMVHADAQHSDAHQTNHNLLLSRDAEIDTKPQLEIHADDVKCSHGATVGQLDDAMVFYLRSRGIDESAARALLTYGFAREIVDRVALEPLRAQLGRDLLAHLPGVDDVRGLIE